MTTLTLPTQKLSGNFHKVTTEMIRGMERMKVDEKIGTHVAWFSSLLFPTDFLILSLLLSLPAPFFSPPIYLCWLNLQISVNDV